MSEPKTENKRALDLLKRFNELESNAGTWLTLWQEIADYVMPRKSQITERKTPDVEGFTDDIYNDAAIEANQVLAAGQKDYMVSGNWFALEPPEELEDDDDAIMKYRDCTKKMMLELSRSNFYMQIHEYFHDRGGLGTAALHCEEGKRNFFNFTKLDVGEFFICEDDEGFVDTVFRKISLTSRQCAQKFGMENLPPQILNSWQAYNDNSDPKAADKKWDIVHIIEPRMTRNSRFMDGANKPVGSTYISVKDKEIIQEGGYDEMPTAVSRYLKWGKEPYGYCPSIIALPTVKQVNFIEQQMDALAEIAAFPRILAPVGQEGDIDLRSAGVTPYDVNPAAPEARPQEWATSGRYDVGKDRIEVKEEAIRRAYHVDLFQMLKQLDQGDRTAYEIAERLAEKVASFSPTFYRVEHELLQPMLMRCFAMMYRAGKFGDFPISAMMAGPEGPVLPMPKVTLTSKLALAIKAVENNSFLQLISIFQPLAELKPEILDNMDFDKAFRGIAHNLSVPTDWLTTVFDRDALRQARAQQEQAMAAAEAAPQVAAAAKDLAEANEGGRNTLTP